MIVLHVLAQSSTSNGGELLPSLIERLGTAAIVAALTIWWALTERKERTAAQALVTQQSADALARERDFNEKERQAHERERERAERLALVLHDAAETLSAVKSGMYAALDRAQTPHPGTDANLRRMELAVDELTKLADAARAAPTPSKEA